MICINVMHFTCNGMIYNKFPKYTWERIMTRVLNRHLTARRTGLTGWLFLLILSLFMLSSATDALAASRELTAQNVKVGTLKRVALVIGNSKYQSSDVPQLSNPVNDANSMADTLSRLGFDVTEVTDASQKQMNRAIAEFGTKLGPDSVGLFYYAGHGVQMKGKNYLVPVDADITDAASIPAETVDVEVVLAQLEGSPMSIIILDACRNNPFKKTRSIGGGGLAQMDAPKGSFIAYATAPGQTAQDGSGANGLYTQALLKNIQTPGISLEEVFKRVRSDVSKQTQDAQIPWESTSLTGNFYFMSSPDEQIEDTLWESIKGSNARADFDTYLTRYPKGRYADQAKTARDRLLKRDQDAAMQRQQEQQQVTDEQKKMNAERQQLDAEKRKLEEDKKKNAVNPKPEPAPYVPPAF